LVLIPALFTPATRSLRFRDAKERIPPPPFLGRVI
jgi:hypothetical protein